MDWLADILKNLAVSRTLVSAIFITAVVMYFGPGVAPTYVPKLKAELVPYIFGGMLLSGALLVLWGSEIVLRFGKSRLHVAARALSGSELSEPEMAMLFYMAKDPTEVLNLDYIDYSKAPGTKLEFHQIAKGLEKKGLISINSFDDNLLSLTEEGRVRALEIQRKVKLSGVGHG